MLIEKDPFTNCWIKVNDLIINFQKICTVQCTSNQRGLICNVNCIHLGKKGLCSQFYLLFLLGAHSQAKSFSVFTIYALQSLTLNFGFNSPIFVSKIHIFHSLSQLFACKASIFVSKHHFLPVTQLLYLQNTT